MGIPSLDSYLEQQGFALLEDQTGKLSLIKYGEAKTPSAVASMTELIHDAVTGGPHKVNRGKTSGPFAQSPAFRAFKEINKENIEAAAKGFAEEEDEVRFRQRGREPVAVAMSALEPITAADVVPAGTAAAAGAAAAPLVARGSLQSYGNEEAAAGLYAEHELLQAVFGRGLQLGGEHEHRKGQLVQKLYGRAYEMLIGGRFPVVSGADGFSRTIRNNPVAAAAELFSRARAFHFDVLVVDDGDRVRQHVLCAMEPLRGSDESASDSSRTFLVAGPATAHLTAQARAVAGPFSVAPRKTRGGSSGSSGSSGSTSTAMPTYTQHMAYQTSLDAGQFHVFRSQPSGSGHDDDGASEAETVVPAGEHAGDIDEEIGAEAWVHGSLADVADRDSDDAMEYLEHDGHGLDLGSSSSSSLNGGVRFVDLVRGRPDAAAAALGKHGCDQTASSRSPAAKRCRIYDDLQYLMGTMRQDEAELRGQLARGQRPAVLANIYRGQAAAAMGGEGCDAGTGSAFGSAFSPGSHPARLGLAGYDFPADGSGDDMLASFFADDSGSGMTAGSAAAAAAQMITTASADAAEGEGMQFIQWPTN